jgi:small-conductance mechanosensitive channel
MLILAKQSFLEANAEWISALVIVVITLITAKFVDIFLARSADHVATTRESEPLSKAAVTRLRIVHRLVVLAVVLIGVFLALAQIDALQSLGTALLASSAVIGVALGIAARAVLANAVSGMMLATVQPFRIGDVIKWQDYRGRVEDITLSYTFVRLPSGHRLVIPNDVIATSPLENFTIAGTVVEGDAKIELAPDKATPAVALLRQRLDGATVALGECMVDRAEIVVSFSAAAGHEITQRIETREQVVAILSDAGMLSGSSQTA